MTATRHELPLPASDTAEIYIPGTRFVVGGEKVNKKQLAFLKAVFCEKSSHLFYHYGGAIRGGKTFVVLLCLHRLSVRFPKSRWAVVRSDLPALKTTTIPSFKKVIDTDIYGAWNYSTPISFKYSNGSEIIFVSENYKNDKELKFFLGTEFNGFFLEQLEDLTIKMWEMAQQRAGSHYVATPLGEPFKMRPLIFTTTNPTQGWAKRTLYEPYKAGTLGSDHYYLEALPSDNPHVTEEQWRLWGNMSEVQKEIFLKANWSDFSGHDAWRLVTDGGIGDMMSNYFVEAGTKYLTCDIAGTGEDSTVIMVWQGWQVVRVVKLQQKADPQAYIKNIEVIRNMAAAEGVAQGCIIYDAQGIGQYIKSMLPDAVAFIGSAGAAAPFFNKRSECFFKIAEKINERGIWYACEEYREEVKEELQALRQEPYIEDGKRRVVNRETLKEKIGRSPDFISAMMLRAAAGREAAVWLPK